MVSGNTDLVYLVDTTPNSDDPNISDYAALDPYKAVGINGTPLHVSLNGETFDSFYLTLPEFLFLVGKGRRCV